MSASITLSPSVRQNLLSLQNTASLMLATQNRLATGKKVNSALDNASSFFTASALNNRANALNSVIDSVSNGIQIFAAANNGLTGITHLLESMQAVLNQTGQSQTNQTASYGIGSVNTSSVQNMSFSGGSVGASPVQVALNTIDVATPATAATVTASADYVAPTAVSGPVATTGGNWLALVVPNGRRDLCVHRQQERRRRRQRPARRRRRQCRQHRQLAGGHRDQCRPDGGWIDDPSP